MTQIFSIFGKWFKNFFKFSEMIRTFLGMDNYGNKYGNNYENNYGNNYGNNYENINVTDKIYKCHGQGRKCHGQIRKCHGQNAKNGYLCTYRF